MTKEDITSYVKAVCYTKILEKIVWNKVMSISTHKTSRNLKGNKEVPPCMVDTQYISVNEGSILWVTYYCYINFQMHKLKQSESESIF